MAKLLNLLKLRSFVNAGDPAVEVSVVSDTQPRLRVDAGGKYTWGAGGTSAGDTNLYRSAADTLKTDDYFVATGGLTVKTVEIDPASASSGQVLQYNGTKFAPANFSSGATVSDGTPSSPTQGQVWFESDTGKTFVYYDSYWVEISGGRGDTNPVGAVTAFAGATAPTGWLLCFGQTVSRTVYASLFTVVGTTYNTGGEAGTDFRLPDLRGRTIAGIDNMGGTDAGRLDIANSSGTVVGSQYVTLTSAEMPSHTHIQNAHNHTGTADTAGSHSHGYVQPYNTSGMGPAGSYGYFHYERGAVTDSAGSHGHSLTINNTTPTNQNTGGGGAHNNMQPTMVLNYITKAL